MPSLSSRITDTKLNTAQGEQMKIQAKDKLLIQLHKVIGKVGKIAAQDNDNMNNLLKIGIWDEETVLE